MTTSSDVHVRVRASGNPDRASEGAPERGGSAYARAISRLRPSRQQNAATNPTSLHVTEVASTLTSGWAMNEAPPAPAAMWRQVFPDAAEATNPVVWLAMSIAGAARALIIQTLWLVGRMASTRRGAGALLAAIVVIGVARTIAHALAH